MAVKLMGGFWQQYGAMRTSVAALPHSRWNSTTSSSTFTLKASLDPRARLARRTQDIEQKLQQEKAMEERAKALEKHQTRSWRTGDVYSPHDLSPSEMRKWRKKKSPATDAFDALALNPLHQYKNFAIMSEYISELGRIKPSSETGLRPVNQRKIAKAIRRAKALGLMPGVYRHPEILMRKSSDPRS